MKLGMRMRHSMMVLGACVALSGYSVGCGDDADDDDQPVAGSAGGSAGKAGGSAGKAGGGAGKAGGGAGTAGKAGGGGTGGSGDDGGVDAG